MRKFSVRCISVYVSDYGLRVGSTCLNVTSFSAKSYLCAYWSQRIAVFFQQNKQVAQLSQRDRAVFHVTQYFAKSLRVIQNGTIRILRYDFLFAFHSYCGFILCRFRDKSRYLPKIAIFSYPLPAFDAPVRGSPSECCHTV